MTENIWYTRGGLCNITKKVGDSSFPRHSQSRTSCFTACFASRLLMYGKFLLRSIISKITSASYVQARRARGNF